jgi:hypothetical protein
MPYRRANGIHIRRPSGQIETVPPDSDPRHAVALDVDGRGVVHVVQEFFGSEAFRITPLGQIGGLVDASGDGLGRPMDAARDVVVADGPVKTSSSWPAIAGTRSSSRTPPRCRCSDPPPRGLLALAMGAIPALAGRRRR